jgi:hypothetical protein
MRFFIGSILLILSLGLCAQTDKPYSVYFIGDAGEDTTSGKALLMLKEQLLSDPNSAVIFLGDNVYPEGFCTNDHLSELRLQSQLNILKEYKGQAYFMPGNHDWEAQKRKGLKRLKEEEVYVNEYLKNNSSLKNKNERTFLPADGLPGPETVMLNGKLRLIIIDTQWFLHFYKKNKTGSKKNTRILFYKHLDSLLAYSVANNQQVVVAGHHPMFTNGSHSRKLQPWRFLINCTPFQIFGTMGLNRLFSQDISQPTYRKMRKRMINSFENYNNIIYVSGHDHNLQFFKENNNKYIVSGCGSKLEHLKKKRRFQSVYQDDSKTGFVKLQYFSDNKVVTTIFRTGEKEFILNNY